MYNYEKQIKIFTDYFKSGEKEKKEYLLGAEFENFIVYSDTYKTVSYYGEGGVEETLLHFVNEKDYEPHSEKGHVIAASKGDYSLTTEPGGQFEMSLAPKKSISEIDKAYEEFFSDLCSYLREKGQRILDMGYHPVTRIDEIKLLPKVRYDNMFDYFKTRGNRAHNMMKGTCALQLSIDYSNETDFIKKMKAIYAVSNVLYAMFDSAYFFEGSAGKMHCIRAHIWENTDSDRSGIIPGIFADDFSYRKYAEYILNRPAIFAYVNGELSYTKNKLVRDLFDPENHTKEELEHLLTMFFPDARVKHYIEIRMIDCIPYPLNMAALALLEGLFYNGENVEKLYEFSKCISEQELVRSRHEMYDFGLDASLAGEKLKDHARNLFAMAKNGVPEQDLLFLNPLEPLVMSGESPYDIIEREYKNNGLSALDKALYGGECGNDFKRSGK